MRKRGLLIALAALLACALMLSVAVMADVNDRVTICVGETVIIYTHGEDYNKRFTVQQPGVLAAAPSGRGDQFIGVAPGSATVKYEYTLKDKVGCVAQLFGESASTTYERDVTTYTEVTVISGLKMGNLALTVGTRAQMPLEINPFYKGKEAGTWASSDENVATVDETGMVTAHTLGRVQISFTLEFTGITERAMLDVEPPPPPPPSLELAGETEYDAVVGEAFSGGLTATGGAGGYVYTSNDLPAWLTLDPATGEFSGTPDAAGPYAFTVVVTDSLTATASADVTVTVADAPPPPEPLAFTGPDQVSVPETNSSVPIDVAVTGGTKPYEYQVVAYDVTVVSFPNSTKTGDDTGTWQCAVNFIDLRLTESTQVTIEVTDAKGETAQQVYTLTPLPAQDQGIGLKVETQRAKKTKIKRIEEIEFADDE